MFNVIKFVNQDLLKFQASVELIVSSIDIVVSSVDLIVYILSVWSQYENISDARSRLLRCPEVRGSAEGV